MVHFATGHNGPLLFGCTTYSLPNATHMCYRLTSHLDNLLRLASSTPEADGAARRGVREHLATRHAPHRHELLDGVGCPLDQCCHANTPIS